jgi:hypothetical protein
MREIRSYLMMKISLKPLISGIATYFSSLVLPPVLAMRGKVAALLLRRNHDVRKNKDD